MVPTPKRETAGEIAKRYGLAELVRVRMMARRLYLNSLAKRASISFQDSLDVVDPDNINPFEFSLLNSRRYLFLNDPVRCRRSLPALDTRYSYNRRLAEIEAERIDAEDAAERMVTRYLTRSKAKKISGAESDKDKNDNDNIGDDSNEDNNNEQNDKEMDDDDLLEDELLETGYYDYLTDPYDLATWRHARRLYRRRLPLYRFRPLATTTRLLERRLRDV